MDRKKIRFGIQAAATLIQNANIRGFLTGRIYEGASKSVCVPGLNCYSCPAAAGSCPLGSLQQNLGNLKKGVNKLSYKTGSRVNRYRKQLWLPWGKKGRDKLEDCY